MIADIPAQNRSYKIYTDFTPGRQVHWAQSVVPIALYASIGGAAFVVGDIPIAVIATVAFAALGVVCTCA